MASGLKAKYQPSAAERQRVQKLMAYGHTVEEARQLMINPATDKPLSDTTFLKVFRREVNTDRDIIG
jgi:hypothetical protein